MDPKYRISGPRIDSELYTLIVRCRYRRHFAMLLSSVARLLYWHLDVELSVQSSIIITSLHLIKSATYGGITHMS
jgi:hypothetical protein